jgi:methylaspartate ammonia-lyase
MRIKEVLFTKGTAGFFFDDQLAIRSGLGQNGFVYEGSPQIPGFERIRVPAESVSIMLVLDDGEIALGDCCAVQYSGAGGRDPLFLAMHYIPWMERSLKPELLGRECSNFRQNAQFFDSLKTQEGKLLHTAIRYGVTQALLDAAGKSVGCTITEVVAREYGLSLDPKPIKIIAQTGDDRYTNAEKMILKGVDILPHGLINNPYKKVGPNGEKFKEYLVWLRKRIFELRMDENYYPELHFDVYGTFGIVFENNLSRIIDYLADLEEAAKPFPLRIECPVDAGSREGQVEVLKTICQLLEEKGLSVEIVADEWCNTLEDIELFAREKAGHMIQIKVPDLGGINNTIQAVLSCKAKGVKAYQGGSCTETEVTARISTQVALATQPYQILAKPGMGVDEGYMIVKNEMARTIALLKSKSGAH